MRFSSGAELPTDFVDSVPVSEVEAKGGGRRIFVMNTNLGIVCQFFSKVCAAMKKKNTQMSSMFSLKREQDSLPQIKLRFNSLENFLLTSRLLSALPNLAKSKCGSCKEKVDSL